ncbi:CASP-like protein 2A2 [Cardamine amara subsp. amara]|uniref:CASP-like protein n=1 Tax=Cardamine amara subsp. amara TaxID=228776 RepID=A0ABD1A6K2_CARAN
MVETILRVASMALSLSGLVIMIKNSVSNDFGSLSYSNLVAFMYLVSANGVCATYSLFSALAISDIPCPISKLRVWTFFFFDQVVTYVVLAAVTVSAETLYLAYKGNKAITWSSACDSYGVFCHKALVSVLFTFVVSILYMSLSFISSYRLFSRFEAL